MSSKAVLVAIRAHLEVVAGLPDIIWPNEAKTVQTPYLIFDNGGTGSNVLGLSGAEEFTYRPQISVMTRENKFTTESDALCDLICAAFKIGTDIINGSTKVAHCSQSPVPDAGRPDGGKWRRDITIFATEYRSNG